MTVTFGSLFAGIGGFDLAFERAGMKCLWQAEIDRQASQVLKAHWPDVPNYGDITAMRGDAIPPVQVICGGFPCQDLSVAGRRAGLDGARSGLFFEFVRIAGEMREATTGLYPEILVIENVPGLFSSNKGADFGVLLDTLADSGALDIGWRVLDAQWHGVPQRRRRVFIVVDFRGRRAGEILSLSESLSGDSPPSRKTGESVTYDLAPSLTASGRGVERVGESRGQDPVIAVPYDPAAAITSKWAKGTGGPAGDEVQNLVAFSVRGRAGGVPFVPIPIQNATRGKSQNGLGIGNPGDPLYTLDVASQHAIAFGHDQGLDIQPSEDHTPTLRSGGQGVAIAFRKSRRAQSKDDHESWVEDDVTNTLNAFDVGEIRTTQAVVAPQYMVRRLTPRECERLQGFPDDWTMPPLALKPLSDSARYKALGNAVAVPVVERIGRQIVKVL